MLGRGIGHLDRAKVVPSISTARAAARRRLWPRPVPSRYRVVRAAADLADFRISPFEGSDLMTRLRAMMVLSVLVLMLVRVGRGGEPGGRAGQEAGEADLARHDPGGDGPAAQRLVAQAGGQAVEARRLPRR